MAGVAAPVSHHRHTGSISSLEHGGLLSTAPRIEMLRNPDFSFPAMPAPRAPRLQPPMLDTGRRPVSVHANASPNLALSTSHRCNKSAVLPSFSFNAADATGLKDAYPPTLDPDESLPETPSLRSRGHKRTGSEFVGGKGIDNVLSASPTKSSGFPPSTHKRGHSHRRTVSKNISASELNALRASNDASEPTLEYVSPQESDIDNRDALLEQLVATPDGDIVEKDPFGPPLENLQARPPSRRVVGFSENLEYIPRPLSTISSETESSMTTGPQHSLNNSISSVLSLGSPSPPASRAARIPLSTTFEDEDHPRKRSSVEISKRVEKEGEWLKSRSSQSLRRLVSEPNAASTVTFAATPEPTPRPRNVQSKRHSFTHAFSLDRRRSEPSISLKAGTASQLSAVSLQEQFGETKPKDATEEVNTQDEVRRYSTKRIRDWAFTKISRRPKSTRSSSSETLDARRPVSAGDFSVPGMVPFQASPAAETDLDAVLGSADEYLGPASTHSTSQQRYSLSTPMSTCTNLQPRLDADDAGAMLDLDTALGPLNTPYSALHKQRRELHSSRGTRDFNGPGLHYNPIVHRRAESAPELAPFNRNSMPPQSLPDVFEGEGEEETEDNKAARPASSESAAAEVASVAISVVDAAEPGRRSNWGARDGLRISSGDWEPERPRTSYGNVSSRLSTSSSHDLRPSFVVEDTIMEEVSSAEALEIVEAHEEPRASSLTKSSESSETPTVIASQTDALGLPDPSLSLTTPDSNYQASTFSSPDFGRRQGSFDTSRIGTAASSITDNRTLSSCAGDRDANIRMSVDDVPSLTSSRSTMISTMHANTSARDFGAEQLPTAFRNPPAGALAEHRRKRASIQSLSQLVGGSFSGKYRSTDALRPATAIETGKPVKTEHRLKKLMFWRSKSKQSLRAEAA